jgi:hypothetical protein
MVYVKYRKQAAGLFDSALPDRQQPSIDQTFGLPRILWTRAGKKIGMAWTGGKYSCQYFIACRPSKTSRLNLKRPLVPHDGSFGTSAVGSAERLLSCQISQRSEMSPSFPPSAQKSEVQHSDSPQFSMMGL